MRAASSNTHSRQHNTHHSNNRRNTRHSKPRHKVMGIHSKLQCSNRKITDMPMLRTVRLKEIFTSPSGRGASTAF